MDASTLHTCHPSRKPALRPPLSWLEPSGGIEGRGGCIGPPGLEVASDRFGHESPPEVYEPCRGSNSKPPEPQKHKPEGGTIRTKKPKTPNGTLSANTESPETRQTALKLASLAISWMKQDRQLRVRQREELRRALANAAEFRGWGATGADPVSSAIKDVKDLTIAGSHFIAQDLVDELAGKKTEVSQLREVADSIHELADAKEWGDPVEVSYSHTVREGDGLVTRTQTLTLVDAEEAKEAAATIEKKLGAWEKLRVQMLDDLKLRQRQVNELEGSISAFAESSKGMVGEVLAILH